MGSSQLSLRNNSPLLLVVPDVQVSDLIEVVRNHKYKCEPLVFLLSVHPEDNHEEYEFGEQCKLEDGVIAKWSYLAIKLRQSSVVHIVSI